MFFIPTWDVWYSSPQQKLSIMGNIIILRGEENTGKTTTIRLLFQSLMAKADDDSTLRIWHGHSEDFFECKVTHAIQDNDRPTNGDFNAILTINKQKIGIVSEGDEVEEVKNIIHRLENESLNLLICCTRSKNTENSVYRMIEEETLPKYSKKKEFITDNETLAEKIERFTWEILQQDKDETK